MLCMKFFSIKSVLGLRYYAANCQLNINFLSLTRMGIGMGTVVCENELGRGTILKLVPGIGAGINVVQVNYNDN